MKRVLRRDTIDRNVVLLDYKQCVARLRELFCCQEWKDDQVCLPNTKLTTCRSSMQAPLRLIQEKRGDFTCCRC